MEPPPRADALTGTTSRRWREARRHSISTRVRTAQMIYRACAAGAAQSPLHEFVPQSFFGIRIVGVDLGVVGHPQVQQRADGPRRAAPAARPSRPPRAAAGPWPRSPSLSWSQKVVGSRRTPSSYASFASRARGSSPAYQPCPGARPSWAVGAASRTGRRPGPSWERGPGPARSTPPSRPCFPVFRSSSDLTGWKRSSGGSMAPAVGSGKASEDALAPNLVVLRRSRTCGPSSARILGAIGPIHCRGSRRGRRGCQSLIALVDVDVVSRVPHAGDFCGAFRFFARPVPRSLSRAV